MFSSSKKDLAFLPGRQISLLASVIELEKKLGFGLWWESRWAAGSLCHWEAAPWDSPWKSELFIRGPLLGALTSSLPPRPWDPQSHHFLSSSPLAPHCLWGRIRECGLIFRDSSSFWEPGPRAPACLVTLQCFPIDFFFLMCFIQNFSLLSVDRSAYNKELYRHWEQEKIWVFYLESNAVWSSRFTNCALNSNVCPRRVHSSDSGLNTGWCSFCEWLYHLLPDQGGSKSL